MPKLILTKMRMPKGQAPRWRKKYKGNIYYFRGTYQDAVRQWERRKVELDGEDKTQYERAIRNRKEIETAVNCLNDYWATQDLKTFTPSLSPEAIARLAELPSKESLEAALASGERLPPLTKKEINPFSIFPDADQALIIAGLERWESLTKKETPPTSITTIGQGIDAWLVGKRSQVILGSLRQSTLSSTTLDINYFRKWAGENTPISSISEHLLSDFFNHLAGEIGAGRVAKGYGHQIMLYTKSFIKEQWRMHRIELPRNLDSRNLSIRVPVKTVEIMTLEEIQAYYNRGTSLLRACILLSLNCAFNQIDIATLKHSEVDWSKGTITKKRIKTGGNDNVPTVQWKLWPTTLAALKQHRSKHPELVLLGRNGQQLIKGGGLQKWMPLATSGVMSATDLGSGGNTRCFGRPRLLCLPRIRHSGVTPNIFCAIPPLPWPTSTTLSHRKNNLMRR